MLAQPFEHCTVPPPSDVIQQQSVVATLAFEVGSQDFRDVTDASVKRGSVENTTGVRDESNRVSLLRTRQVVRVPNILSGVACLR